MWPLSTHVTSKHTDVRCAACSVLPFKETLGLAMGCRALLLVRWVLVLNCKDMEREDEEQAGTATPFRAILWHNLCKDGAW